MKIQCNSKDIVLKHAVIRGNTVHKIKRKIKMIKENTKGKMKPTKRNPETH